MKLQEIVKKHKAINEYLRITGGKLSANFTHQYLPLFYSGSSLDTVMQNIIIALLGNLLQQVGSLSLIKTISISIPAVKVVLSFPRLKVADSIKKTSAQLKHSFSSLQFRVDQVGLKLTKGNKVTAFSGRYPFSTSLNQFNYKRDQHPPAASA